jgi:hypothetical protein
VTRQISTAWAALQQAGRGAAPFADCAWIARLAAAPAVTGLRPDARRHRLAIASFIRACADWRSLRSRPTLARVIAYTAQRGLGQLDDDGHPQGLSERCVQYHLRALEQAGWLAVLEEGTTWEFRPWALHRHDPNLAREWRLTFGDRTSCTPPLPPRAGAPAAGARETPPITPDGQDHELARRFAPDSSLPPPHRRPWEPPWPLDRTAQRRRERLAACESLRGRCVALVPLSARALRSILRPWLESPAWTPAHILRAVSAPRSGEPYMRAGPVRSPAAWLRARMAEWLGADGNPLPPPSPGHGPEGRHRRRAW